MKRILFALSLFCAAPLQAQVDYQFTDFASTSHGFSGTLLFRNNQLANAPTTFSITSLTWGVSDRVKTFCGSFGYYVCTNFGDAGTHLQGAVQQSTFNVGAFTWSQFDVFGHARCSDLDGIPQWSCRFAADQNYGKGALGCALPTGGSGSGPKFYAGRTCLAEGYDGWFALAVGINFNVRDANDLPPLGTFDASDFVASFGMTNLGVTVTPEPSTWALMLFGLGAIAATKRKAKRSA